MRIIAFLLALGAVAAPAHAQDERRYSVTDFDKVRIDGGFRVEMVTDRSPFAIASGPYAAIEGVKVRVEGRTLIVSANRDNWAGTAEQRRQPVVIRIGGHDLKKAYVNGSGYLSVDRVEGASFSLSVQGTGRATVEEIEVDSFDLLLNGAASARVGGDVEDSKIALLGLSALDADTFDTDRLDLVVDGPGRVTLGRAGDAKVRASGTGEVTLGGRPTCTLNLMGAPVVAGCK